MILHLRPILHLCSLSCPRLHLRSLFVSLVSPNRHRTLMWYGGLPCDLETMLEFLSHISGFGLPSRELPSENGPLMAPLYPPRPLDARSWSRLAFRSASLRFFLSAFSCSLVLAFSRSIASFSSVARSSLLLRPVNVGFIIPRLPRVEVPRRTAGDADRDALRLPSRCTAGRPGESVPSAGVAAALRARC